MPRLSLKNKQKTPIVHLPECFNQYEVIYIISFIGIWHISSLGIRFESEK